MDYFPLVLASGEAFCNRVDETKQLKQAIENNKPTLVASTRRYGKTSLVLNVVEKSKLPYAYFDFLSAIDEADIEKIILRGVGKLIEKVEKSLDKALRVAADLFSGLNIKVGLDALGFSLDINKQKEKTAYTILEVLERLKNLCKKHNTKIVLFFDEFQRLLEIHDSHAIESVIRQVAQQSGDMVFVFSGSNRHLLNQMFNDRNRPFYKLCDRITLDRISSEDYTKYIQHAAQETFKKPLKEDVIERVLHHTERHPYYVNLLCSRLWRSFPSTADEVTRVWNRYAEEERSQVSAEMDLLSKNQRRLLIMLARHGGTNAPRGNEFQSMAKMSSTTIRQSLMSLEQKDYIFKDKEGYYRVLDPLIRAVMAEI